MVHSLNVDTILGFCIMNILLVFVVIQESREDIAKGHKRTDLTEFSKKALRCVARLRKNMTGRDCISFSINPEQRFSLHYTLLALNRFIRSAVCRLSLAKYNYRNSITVKYTINNWQSAGLTFRVSTLMLVVST